MFLITVCTCFTIFALLYAKANKRQLLTPLGETRTTTSKSALVFFVAVLVIVSTLRHGFIDTYAYKIMYRSSRGDLEYVNSAPWGVEAGWLYLLYLLNYLSASPKLMLFLVALSVNFAYAWMSKKYSSDVIFSLFVYFCIGYMTRTTGCVSVLRRVLQLWLFRC